MTPGARVSAAIEILDAVAGGRPVEAALTGWARAHRFAGSSDRAAIRDHVFDVTRRRRSAAAMGGGEDGRATMIGALRMAGADLDALFSGEGHAPPPLTPAERAAGRIPEDRGARLDCPDWLLPRFDRALGDAADPVLAALRERAPVTLRVNAAKADRDGAAERLAADGVETAPHPLSPTALVVTDGARAVRGGRAFREGLVELQDAASQAVADLVPLWPEARILDFCAGGGGKALALAARELGARIVAHDADPARMRDLPGRAARAGAVIELASAGTHAAGAFDVVLADAPCSGSGAWRRSPEAKWTLTPERLDALADAQDAILARAASLVAPGGHLIFATCSLFLEEGAERVAALQGWRVVAARRLTPLDGGDGFFAARLARTR